jgi:preprotein translocase subunit SecA
LLYILYAVNLEKIMFSYFKKIFGTPNSRTLKSFGSIVTHINSLEPHFVKLSDEELRAQTNIFRQQLAEGKTLDDILPEAFALVREAAKRTLGQRHFDVQLIGGIALHKGMIAEMRTGEGKTLVATAPTYLNALTGEGCHVVTVNDYLARRDSEWMGQIHRALGLEVACLTSNTPEYVRDAVYKADITYGTNNEFGFDYLRDNLKFDLNSMVQKQFNFAIVDEVDSILIDEARTPLIISGAIDQNPAIYKQVDSIVSALQNEDFEVDEKGKSSNLTDKGNISAENLLKNRKIIKDDSSLFDIENIQIFHYINQSLKARNNFQRDVDYIVKDNKVMIIDEFTGRIMDGRRYSDGLHQALEAKEQVEIQRENQTLASITFQNYFRMYKKLAGMTGTAMTEAAEFSDIYKLEVLEIPTNLPVKRIDEDDEIYRTADEKYKAIVDEIEAANRSGQPVLVGTVSIEKSEYLSGLLKKRKIKHNVLNARYHEQEAEIIAQAGRFGAVTIATNMAGRGTDIKLGGNEQMLAQEENKKLGEKANIAEVSARVSKQVEEEKQKVLAAGGLFVIGTERHESRRIDNQLRGRSGRQGDPGRTKFYLSLEDDLMRIFGSEKLGGLLARLGLKNGEAIVHPWISKSLEKAQKRVEARNYDIRKTLLKFDDVLNNQRRVIYEQRREIMQTDDLTSWLEEMVAELNQQLVARHLPANAYAEEWDLSGLAKELFRIYGQHINFTEDAVKQYNSPVDVLNFINTQVNDSFAEKTRHYGTQLIHQAQKHIFLLTLDQLWKDHINQLDHLRSGINLRAYAQKDPLNEYKFEAFDMFKHMLDAFAEMVVSRISHLEITHTDPDIALQAPKTVRESRGELPESLTMPINQPLGRGKKHVEPENRNPQDPQTWGKIARNDPCPCGSGKKYKHCHGAI